MRPFDLLFPEIAERECRVLRPINDSRLPNGTFLLREFYCAERGCDCRRVLLRIWWEEGRREVATVNYAFEPPLPPYDDEPQAFLDPLNPQSELSGHLLDLFEAMLEHDPAYHDRLVRHYDVWKAVVEDPAHPEHGKVVDASGDARRGSSTAVQPQPPVRRSGPKIGPNAPCPCGSGKKYKRCCRA